MKNFFKVFFKIFLFIINLILGIIATFYLVVKFKAKKKAKNDQLTLLEDKEEETKLKETIAQGKRTEEVYRLIKEFKEVDMPLLLSKVNGVTERTLRRDLAKLQTMKLVKKSGSTKSAKYSLTK